METSKTKNWQINKKKSLESYFSTVSHMEKKLSYITLNQTSLGFGLTKLLSECLQTERLNESIMEIISHLYLVWLAGSLVLSWAWHRLSHLTERAVLSWHLLSFCSCSLLRTRRSRFCRSFQSAASFLGCFFFFWPVCDLHLGLLLSLSSTIT